MDTKRILKRGLVLLFALLLPLSLRPTALAQSGESDAAEAYELFYAAMLERSELNSPTGLPDYFCGAWIDEGDGRLHIDFCSIPEPEFDFYKELLSGYERSVVFGTARFSFNELTQALDEVISEFLKAGINYTSCDVHVQTNSVRIAVQSADYERAAKLLPSLDCVKARPELLISLSADTLTDPLAPVPTAVPGENEAEAPKGSNFPILAVLFGAAAIAIFFLRQRAKKRRIMQMKF